MGSWSETCSISNLPINEGDEVVAMLFHETEYYGILSHSDSLFSPYPLLINGIYDDYGGLYNVSGDVNLFCDIIEQEYEVDEDDINAYNHYFDRNDMDDITYKFMSYLKYLVGNYNKIAIGYVHKKLFDELSKVNDYFVLIDKLIEEYVNAFTFKCRLRKLKQHEPVDGDKISKLMLKSFVSTGCFHKFDVSDEKYINRDSIKKILGVDSSFLQLRKLWMPSSMVSQNGIEQSHKILCDFYANYIKQEETKYE